MTYSDGIIPNNIMELYFWLYKALFYNGEQALKTQDDNDKYRATTHRPSGWMRTEQRKEKSALRSRRHQDVVLKGTRTRRALYRRGEDDLRQGGGQSLRGILRRRTLSLRLRRRSELAVVSVSVPLRGGGFWCRAPLGVDRDRVMERVQLLQLALLRAPARWRRTLLRRWLAPTGPWRGRGRSNDGNPRR